MMQELYQNLYDTTDYGKFTANKCPGVRYLPNYQKWLKSKIIDLGCGTGETVKHICTKGFEAYGIDQVTYNCNMLVGNICEPLDLSKYTTALCLDVFEHLYDCDLIRLITNMQQTQRQIISVFSGMHVVNNTNLHVNLKSILEWEQFISKYFTIKESHRINDHRKIYYCNNHTQ